MATSNNCIFSLAVHSSLSPCIMCVQYRGGVKYRGGYHEYCGGYLEYHGDVQYRGGYLEYCGGVQYRGGYHVTVKIQNLAFLQHLELQLALT